MWSMLSSGMQILGKLNYEIQSVSQNVWLTAYLACIIGEKQHMGTQAKYVGLPLMDIH